MIIKVYLKKKIQKLIIKIIQSFSLIFNLIIFFLPLVLLRLLRPFLIIRIGYIESSAIGHFAWPLQVYISEQEFFSQRCNLKKIDIWYFEKKISNSFLKKKYHEKFLIFPSFILKPLDYLNQIIPGGDKNRVPYRYYEIQYSFFKLYKHNFPYQHFDIHNVTQNKKPNLKFNEHEKELGKNYFIKNNVNQDKFICFINRDSAYYNHYTYEENRNSSIDLLLPGIIKLTEKKYSAIRMGSIVKENILNNNNKIINYANSSCRNDFLDIYLISKCKFYISTGTGLDSVATLFRKPALILNYPTFGQVEISPNILIFVPKLFWSSSKQRLLSFKEIFEIGAHFFTGDDQFATHDIILLDNKVEILTLSIDEMEKRLNKKWNDTKDDIALQKRFKYLWPFDKMFAYEHKSNKNFKKSNEIPLISSSFLRKYKFLLN